MNAQMEYNGLMQELKNEVEEKPETIRDYIVSLLDKQTAKGVGKYGHTLDDCPDLKYDWNLMALEEALDLIQYLMKKQQVLLSNINRKERIIKQQEVTIKQLAEEWMEVKDGKTA